MFLPVNGDPYRSNVVLHLPMTGANNETTFTDVSPSPKTITRYNAVTSTTQSKWGQGSGYFDGSGDYLSVPSTGLSLVSGDFTIEFWLYIEADRYNRVIGNRSPNGWLIGLSLSSTSFSFWTTSGVFNTVNGPTSSVGWNHIAACRINDTHTFYVNGVGGTPLVTSSRPASGGSTVQIGRDSTNITTDQFLGYLQDLRITTGIARYTADFDFPSGPLSYRLPELPVRSSILQSPSFTQVARLGL